jgi:hypothetical protein
LVIGTSVLALFAATHLQVLPLLGVFVLLAGGALLVVGLLCLYVFARLVREFPVQDAAGAPLPIRQLVVRLLLNIPIAIACIAGGAVLM